MDPRLREYTTDEGTYRIFTDRAVQASIDRALYALGEGPGVASVAHLEPGTGRWVVSAAARIGNDWSIMVAAHKDYTGAPLAVDAAVVWKP